MSIHADVDVWHSCILSRMTTHLGGWGNVKKTNIYHSHRPNKIAFRSSMFSVVQGFGHGRRVEDNSGKAHGYLIRTRGPASCVSALCMAVA